MLEKIEAFTQRHGLFPEGGLVLAAVSGGADSVSLLQALLELSERRGFSVAAMHYNHQLRGGESDRDAAFVKKLCYDKNVPLYTGSGDVRAYGQENGFGLEASARRLRYDFFYETAVKLNAQRIATAHTADDNAETVLLNLTRGSGLRGLGGIPPRRGNIIRPMLTVTRLEVLSFLEARSLPYMEDSTNALPICSRNIIRHRVIPVLKELNPRAAEHITAAAALAREDETYLTGLAQQFIDENLKDDALDAALLAGLPLPIGRRVVRTLAGSAAAAAHVSAVLALCTSGDVSGEVALPGRTVYREYGRIRFDPGPRSPVTEGFRPIEIRLDPDDAGTPVWMPELHLKVTWRITKFSEKINNSFHTFLFKYDNIYGKIVIRPRETGDKIELFGHNGTKSLKKLFIENRIPVRKRPLIPVLADDIGVLGVCGLGFDQRAACQPGDTALEINFEETAYET